MNRSAKSAPRQTRPHVHAERPAAHGMATTPTPLHGQHAPVAQRERIDAIHGSPHQAIQRAKVADTFGSAARRGDVRTHGGAGTIQRAAVKDTKLGEVALIPEVGADFRNNHMADSLDAAKNMSKSADRLARTFKNTVVIGAEPDVKTALGNAAYSATPISVPGLNTVDITTHTTNKSFKPEDVTGQTVVNGGGTTKVKVRLVADDDAKTTTAPTNSPTGPILLATGVMGGPPAPQPKPKAKPQGQGKPKPVPKPQGQGNAQPPVNAAPKPRRRRGPPKF